MANKPTLSIRIDNSLYQQLSTKAKLNKQSLSDYVRNLLDEIQQPHSSDRNAQRLLEILKNLTLQQKQIAVTTSETHELLIGLISGLAEFENYGEVS